MFSEGKCSLQVGLVQLYALVKSLERDFQDLMAGRSVEYGGDLRNYESVAKTLGWTKSRKNRREGNDGRPPDTTDTFLDSECKKKTGRPKGSSNVDRNPVTTYQS